MKTSRDFFERIESDESFANEVGAKIKEKIDSGEKDYKAVWIPVAAEYGYEIAGEELDEMVKNASAELSDEELGKVAGGTSPLVIVTYISVVSVTSASLVLSHKGLEKVFK